MFRTILELAVATLLLLIAFVAMQYLTMKVRASSDTNTALEYVTWMKS